MNARNFISNLLSCTKLKRIEFNFPSISFSRYSWGESDIFELVSGLIKNSYFSHYSAVYLHNLTEQNPKSIYLNYEQPEKPKSANRLTQSGIDTAFSRPPRLTNNTCLMDHYQIHILNGKKTNNLGVINKKNYSLTDIERTLIDITVRPSYSGGVFEVLKIYKNAKDDLYDLSVNRMSALLNKIDYIYPYHQTIGFFLEKAGYDPTQLEIFENYKREFDFYLTNQIKEAEYSPKWRIYYPKGL